MSDGSSSGSSPDVPRVGAVVVAGGSGSRMGGGALPKQYRELLGEPILLWALRPFLDHPAIHRTVVVLPGADAVSPPPWLRELPIRVCTGGAARADSVRNGLQALGDNVEIVLIHDAARPLVTRELIDRVIEAAARQGAIPAVPVTDTVKRVAADRSVEATLDRECLWQAQTPQGFPLLILREAHRRASEEGFAGTDDASLLERYGFPVRIVDGAPENLKITRPHDLVVADALARRLRGG